MMAHPHVKMEPSTSRPACFPVVGVAASADGGALQAFFRGVPATPGFAIVVATPLPSERDPALPASVSRFTTMPVHIGVDRQAVDMNCVYVAPAGSRLEIEAGQLQIQRRDTGDAAQDPIDILFTSLAMQQQHYPVGVILSATDGDGALGLRAIKECGGLTCAQADAGEPSTGLSPSTDISGIADFVSSARAIGARLREFSRRSGASGNASPRHELQESHEQLRSLTEEHAAAIEELKTANEELLCANEEFVSSQEELQAVNERLHATNSLLHRKVDELDRANGDLQSLFESTDVATIFLDRNRLIRSFTPVATQIFNILPTDRGRPLTDLSSRLSLPGFADDLALAYSASKVIERRVEHDADNAHFLMRIAPYRNASQVLDGVVINFTRVSTLTADESRQHVVVAELQHRTRNLLTVVQSIAMQTLPDGKERQSFLDRLTALGRVQSLISQELDDQISLAEIVHFELHAHGADNDARVHVSGPRVTLHRRRVQTLALALHELTTNALKYGALKTAQGRLAIAWELTDSLRHRQVLALQWHESGVAGLNKEYRRGYGHNLLLQVIPYNLNAKTTLEVLNDGISCRIEIPLADAAAR